VMFATYLAGLLKSSLVAGAIAGTPLESMLASDLFRGHGAEWKWATGFAVILFFSWLNVRGTKLVGRASSVFALLLIVPFVLMAIIGGWRLLNHPMPIVHEFVPKGESFLGTASAGLGIVLWNYLGWDGLSTIAEEVDNPQKAYPRALMFGVPLVTLVYLLPTAVGLAFYANSENWTEGAWPSIAQAVGGPWLGTVIGLIALVSPIALFTGSLLASSRVPFVIAEAGFLPKAIRDVHPRFGTPYKAIILCAAVYTLLILQTFQELVKLNVAMYGAALVLEILALIILRYKEPDLPRPFRIRGGLPALLIIAILPISMVTLMVWSDAQDVIEEGKGWLTLGMTAAALISAPLIYWAVTTLRAHKRLNP
jgi:amino acid transporter